MIWVSHLNFSGVHGSGSLGVSQNKPKIMNTRKGLTRNKGGDKAGMEVPESVD